MNIGKFLSLSGLMLLSCMTYGQTTIRKAEKSIERGKPIKTARKEAKKWKKQGFSNLPGSLPIENQIEEAMVLTVLKDENGSAKYLSATGSSRAGSEGVAQANALDNTRALLAGVVQSQVSALVSSNKASTQLSATEVETIDEFLSSSKTLIQSELGPIKPVIVMYRQIDNLFEYRYTIMYELVNAKIAAKNVVKRELKNKLKDNEEELDKILGLK